MSKSRNVDGRLQRSQPQTKSGQRTIYPQVPGLESEPMPPEVQNEIVRILTERGLLKNGEVVPLLPQEFFATAKVAVAD